MGPSVDVAAACSPTGAKGCGERVRSLSGHARACPVGPPSSRSALRRATSLRSWSLARESCQDRLVPRARGFKIVGVPRARGLQDREATWRSWPALRCGDARAHRQPSVCKFIRLYAVLAREDCVHGVASPRTREAPTRAHQPATDRSQFRPGPTLIRGDVQ